jgi:hypothetical protein
MGSKALNKTCIRIIASEIIELNIKSISPVLPADKYDSYP